jgi:hypothetical protein
MQSTIYHIIGCANFQPMNHEKYSILVLVKISWYGMSNLTCMLRVGYLQCVLISKFLLMSCMIMIYNTVELELGGVCAA